MQASYGQSVLSNLIDKIEYLKLVLNAKMLCRLLHCFALFYFLTSECLSWDLTRRALLNSDPQAALLPG